MNLHETARGARAAAPLDTADAGRPRRVGLPMRRCALPTTATSRAPGRTCAARGGREVGETWARALDRRPRRARSGRGILSGLSRGGSIAGRAAALLAVLLALTACSAPRGREPLGASAPTAVPDTPPPPASSPASGSATALSSAPAPRPAPARLATPDLSGPLRLESLLPILLAQSPSLEAAHERIRAAAERYPQAISLPPPMVEATWYVRNAMAPEGNFTRWNFMVQQEIPFPTTLYLRGRVAQKEAEAEAIRYEAAVRDAVTELKEIHAERAYLAGAARVQQAVEEVYRRYADLARGGLPAGRTRLPESFRAEALLAQAEYDGQVIADLSGVADERLRTLLALPAGTPLGAPADAGVLLPVETDVQSLIQLAERHSQELRTAHAEAEAAEIGVRRARSEQLPTFFLGAGRMINDDFNETTGATHDSDVVTLGLTIPVGNPGKVAAAAEAQANASAARADEAAQRLRLRSDVAQAAFRLRNAERLAQLYGKTVVPQAEAALLRSQQMVQEGQESLASSLELAATWQQARIAHLRAIADHAQALAALERILGTSATPVPAEAAK